MAGEPCYHGQYSAPGQREAAIDMKATQISRAALTALFERMDLALEATQNPRAQTLCVFGAAAVLLYGSDERQTQYIDVWRSASAINDRDLAEMARHAGLDLNPEAMDPDRIYLQVVGDGVVRLPAYSHEKAAWPGGKPSEILWAGRFLTIAAPPPEIVAAAKLARADPSDIEDIIYIMAKRQITLDLIAEAVESFPPAARQRAAENVVLLEATIEAGPKR